MSDETLPSVIPRDETELVQVLGYCQERRRGLRVLGRGSKAGWGRPMKVYANLMLNAFAGLRFYEPEELVLSAGAATPMRELQALLDQKGQMFAFEPPDLGPVWGHDGENGTIGGAIACNLAGPRRFKAGAARDHILGIRAMSGGGMLYKGGGRVMKNVTGFDLPKLLCGSHGTLSVLTEVTVKVLPRPETERTLLLPGLGAEAAVRLLAQALNGPDEPSGAAHLPAGLAAMFDFLVADTLAPANGKSATLLRIEGAPASVSWRIDSLRRRLPDFAAAELLEAEPSRALWAAIRDVSPFVRRPGAPLWRVSLAPSAGGAAALVIARALPCHWFLDWAGGLLWVQVAAGADAGAAADGGAGVVRAAVAAAGGGHATLLRAPEAIRRAVPVFEPQPEGLAALTRRVKEQFDPNRILNPGRMYAGV